MADPLSIASSVAGLVSLGLTLCGGLHNYFSAVKDRHQEIEAASHSLTLLQSNIFIIQSSTLKIGHRHALSADGVNQALANCESKLLALQQVMLDFTRDEGLSNIKGKLRERMAIARYPFDQKKLSQLRAQVSETNATLSNFVQNFNLDINISISEDLRILKSYTNANDSITHNMLGNIARRLDAIAISRVQDNNLDTSSHVSDAVVQPRYLQNSRKEERMISTLDDRECTCSDPSTRYVYRKSSYVNRSCGALIVSKQKHIRQRHQPSCILFSQSIQTSKTTFHYLGLRYQLSRILFFSLTREYPPGAYSISFGIQPCNIVESSPAFQAICGFRGVYMYMALRLRRFDVRGQTLALIEDLKTIYKSAGASPYDVDKDGNNIAHASMKNLEVFRMLLSISRPADAIHFENTIDFDDVLVSIRSLLLYFFNTGVPITASNFYQETILQDLWGTKYLKGLFPLHNFLATLDTSFYTIDICKSETFSCWEPDRLASNNVLQIWGKHPDIAEAFGFNNIFRAVMQQDRQKLEAITKCDRLPVGILEVDMYQRNILHASITWPEGLELLLQHSQALFALCDKKSKTVSPLELAASLSGKTCSQPDKWVLCQNCQCAVSAQILLEADCSLPTHLMRQEYLVECSFRCRKLLFKHFTNRRQRLRDLSLALLPPEVLHRYGVTVNSLPDATAKFLWNELESRCSESNGRELEISLGLKPFHSNYSSGGFFEEAICPQMCLLADEFGIKPFDEGCLDPLLSRLRLSACQYDCLEMWITYFNWLLKHDYLKAEYAIRGSQISVLHGFAGHIGKKVTSFPSGEVLSLIAKIFDSEVQSDLPCPCISGAFNRPLASFFSGFTVYKLSGERKKLDVIRSLRNLVGRIEKGITHIDPCYLARCAAHIVAMECLGIRHIGHCPGNDSILKMGDLADEEEWAELLDEDTFLLEKLDDLDAEFEKEFQNRNQSVSDFLGAFFTDRMMEVMQEMAGSLTDDHRRRLLSAGVVLVE